MLQGTTKEITRSRFPMGKQRGGGSIWLNRAVNFELTYSP